MCWDNLEDAYLTTHGNLKVKGHSVVEKESCANCGEPFLAALCINPKHENFGIFCDRKCRNSVNINRLKDGWYVDPMGYKCIRTNKKYIREHTLVVEKVLGRKLKKNEMVHHINLDKCDNRHENLMVCGREYHGWLHHRMEKAWVELKLKNSEVK